MNSYQIRSAKLTESKKIYLDILKRSGREAYNEQLIRDLIKDDFSICLVAKKAGEIVGTLGARREGYRAYWLYFLHSKEEDDGEIEELLMKNFLGTVKIKNANKIASDTPEIKLLKRFGFNEVGRIPKWQSDGKDQVIMFKELK
ncbi:hypothetical protein KAT36_00760 [Candidatus Pacearchaeota archaeon]|nr:hypothetical protein [Candidatus Pacearchaeota archaeon]